MTEDAPETTTPEPKESTEEQVLEILQQVRPDHQLQQLVGVVEGADADREGDEPGMQMPITLNVTGGVVSGTLVPYRVWIEEAADTFVEMSRKGAGPAPDAEEVDANLRVLMRRLFGMTYLEDDPEAIANVPDHERRTIHLLRARISVGGALAPTTGEGVPWRGRLASVGGFLLGTLGT